MFSTIKKVFTATPLALILLAAVGVTEANAICWIEKVEGWDETTIGRTRPNGNGIDTTWIERVEGWNETTVGRIRPNGNGIDISWIEKVEG